MTDLLWRKTSSLRLVHDFCCYCFWLNILKLLQNHPPKDPEGWPQQPVKNPQKLNKNYNEIVYLGNRAGEAQEDGQGNEAVVEAKDADQEEDLEEREADVGLWGREEDEGQ